MQIMWLLGTASAVAAMGACAPIAAVAPPPAVVADATTVDERSALAVEVAYRIAGTVLEAAVDSGRLTGAAAARADAIDAEAARFVGMARRAYDAGNANSYAAAVAQAAPLIVRMRTLAGAGR